MVADSDGAEAKSISFAIFTASARFYVAASNNHPQPPRTQDTLPYRLFYYSIPLALDLRRIQMARRRLQT